MLVVVETLYCTGDKIDGVQGTTRWLHDPRRFDCRFLSWGILTFSRVCSGDICTSCFHSWSGVLLLLLPRVWQLGPVGASQVSLSANLHPAIRKGAWKQLRKSFDDCLNIRVWHAAAVSLTTPRSRSSFPCITVPFYESAPVSVPIGCRAQISWGN